VRPFEYIQATEPARAVAMVTADPDADYVAGGTTQVDLMLRDGILSPSRLIDVTRLPLQWITADAAVIRVGATTTMEELAADPTVSARLPFVRESLLHSASVQLRNMATIGGNLLQRTRCRYYRDPAVAACNKRQPGSGCAAVTGPARMHAILGASPNCIALHASDLAVALVTLDTVVHILGPGGVRSVPLTEFYLEPDGTPDIENILAHGELITDIEIPLLPEGARQTYLKVRDRTSYEFALASAAVAVVVDDSTGRDRVIRDVRIGLGGVGTIPWRAWDAERVLRGAPASDQTFRAAAEATVRDPFTVPGTAFKVELAKRTLVRALQTVTAGTR
jgi:CO/xanthine dehydrogenase FAD-binding subunit